MERIYVTHDTRPKFCHCYLPFPGDRAASNEEQEAKETGGPCSACNYPKAFHFLQDFTKGTLMMDDGALTVTRWVLSTLLLRPRY